MEQSSKPKVNIILMVGEREEGVQILFNPECNYRTPDGRTILEHVLADSMERNAELAMAVKGAVQMFEEKGCMAVPMGEMINAIMRNGNKGKQS